MTLHIVVGLAVGFIEMAHHLFRVLFIELGLYKTGAPKKRVENLMRRHLPYGPGFFKLFLEPFDFRTSWPFFAKNHRATVPQHVSYLFLFLLFFLHVLFLFFSYAA